MGGLFGVVSKDDCVHDLFYGTDYHSHLGTCRGGLAVLDGSEFMRHIHDISNAQFRSKFEDDIRTMHGGAGIGVISDNESQPLLINSHLGAYAIATVGVIKNSDQLAREAFRKRSAHFSEMSGGGINPTELVASMINEEATFADGIRNAQSRIEGSCSMLLLTEQGIYAARDRLGRTPIVIGRKDGAYAATFETASFPNLGYEIDRYVGPAETLLLTPDGIEQVNAPGEQMQICAFLWVYYGFPASCYEGISVEASRYRCGAALARKDTVRVDLVAGVPDSGTGHAIGYANEARVPYGRPFAKYTPTWPRSFMPQVQEVRDLVARMKLLPIRELIQGRRLLFCEDSIVRGTQLRDTVQRLYDCGALEVHMRPACPPLIYGCKFLHFSRSRSDLDLAGRRTVKELEGDADAHLDEYTDPKSDRYAAMVDRIRQRLSLTTLQYQELGDLVEAIGLPKEKLCTYCWDGCEGCGPQCEMW
ncbi:MAG TPA: amidophosphoribosyltransferase [Candidatus Hydrogenedentes bacterium]|nr:amidophosphoribosyltransferase [Candidatus Hydrogenedentota bacterium]HOV73181.1 amidophosphoribosyltransferase [Candidatus Hydrogenedentota bacterium]HPC16787.1 amidophosphoribosyltransferase [Candidatus Hydrogenedentota bacterium]HRT18506.1 amidophosphoribosyltransferase [Candidatus Hydrogenedentota bacterium]HRT63525.1 amidophosphoribosyltransferase [Candidatus Hydrogenedentota bacterium]